MKSKLSLGSMIVLLGLLLLHWPAGLVGADQQPHVAPILEAAEQFCEGVNARDGVLVQPIVTEGYWGHISASLPTGTFTVQTPGSIFSDETAVIYIERERQGLVEIIHITLKKRNREWRISGGPLD